MVTISLCMIVKNESAVLKRCLDSISFLVDEIIIVDTGSTDNTKEIAAGYTDQIYDYPWRQDFSDARNFAFSKAHMEYIYSADADEVLDSANQKRFHDLKEVLLPEIEIVQMKYITQTDSNMVYNAKKELRPKLFKRLREFTWVDPVHETVRLTPVVFDSEIEILHLPQSLHSSRDFRLFLQAFESEGTLSKKLVDMYAKELFISGTEADFFDAAPVFEKLYTKVTNPDEQKEIACVLAHFYRCTHDDRKFFKLCLKDMITTPCSEICLELGEYFYDCKDFEEAILWFYNAAYEAGSILTVRSSGDFPLYRLFDCYRALADRLESEMIHDDSKVEDYRRTAAEYQALADAWQMPEEL